MSTELQKPKCVIVMRTGLSHFVTQETADKLRDVLEQSTGNRFVNISEIGVTINTSQVEGIYTSSQYDDLVKVKQGMFRCSRGNWHGRRESCDCDEEFKKSERDRRRREADEEKNRPLTPEEEKRRDKAIADIKADLIKRGVGKGRKPTLKRSKLIEYEQKFGKPYQVPAAYEIEEDVPNLTK